MKASFKIITLLIVASSLMVSCGKPNQKDLSAKKGDPSNKKALIDIANTNEIPNQKNDVLTKDQVPAQTKATIDGSIGTSEAKSAFSIWQEEVVALVNTSNAACKKHLDNIILEQEAFGDYCTTTLPKLQAIYNGKAAIELSKDEDWHTFYLYYSSIKIHMQGCGYIMDVEVCNW